MVKWEQRKGRKGDEEARCELSRIACKSGWEDRKRRRR